MSLSDAELLAAVDMAEGDAHSHGSHDCAHGKGGGEWQKGGGEWQAWIDSIAATIAAANTNRPPSLRKAG